MRIPTVPSAKQVRRLLASLSIAQLRWIAQKSGVSYGAVRNMQTGVTPNPGIETVRSVLPLIPAALKTPTAKKP